MTDAEVRELVEVAFGEAFEHRMGELIAVLRNAFDENLDPIRERLKAVCEELDAQAGEVRAIQGRLDALERARSADVSASSRGWVM